MPWRVVTNWITLACALALLEAAAPQGIAVTDWGGASAALRAVSWAGRLEVVDRRPTILLDGAHNPAAATALADFLARSDRSHPSRPVVLVLGMMRDKDHRGFCRTSEAALSMTWC